MKTTEQIIEELKRRIKSLEPDYNFSTGSFGIRDNGAEIFYLSNLLSWITQENNLDERKE